MFVEATKCHCTYVLNQQTRPERNPVFLRRVNPVNCVFPQLTGLTHLELRGYRIGVDGEGRLAGVFGQCVSLTHLRGNRIDDAGSEGLEGALGQYTSLTHLDLNGNQIGEGGQRVLSVGAVHRTDSPQSQLQSDR